ncbi:proline-rich protein 12 isoform X2 [Hemibagrus wyckioides]|uniref:proline-rich protein 12 isoform X2 n=1 Tax=Hemibagrus wyckioides TaxID=337641 RepID=UPI00266C3AE8|nr:proline-rich protein 12 isoform X2 [Hemibagrus wyckioides]
MDRNYPGAGFGELGAGTGWSYERSAKASLMYGSSRSSHPDSELLHRQAYATPHPLQGYATNHHPGSSGQAGAWGAAGRSLGLSGLFDAGLHHASPSGPDASVMNLISALESRGPQPPPSASSLLSQFRTPSWQTAMHTPAPAELFISSALPGSGSFPSSSALSAYQHPASFSGRSFSGVTPSLSLQDTPTFSPTSNGLLSPHDPLLHIKTPSQSSLGFDRLLSSQSAAAYRGAQEPSSGSQPQASTSSSARHLPPPQFNLLSSQLQEQSSHLYNASVFSSTPAPSQPPIPQERAIPRQDSVIKHFQRPSPAPSQIPSSTSHPLQHYLSCGASGYQQISHHRHGGMNCSPLGDQSPSSDPKPSPRSDQVYRPIVQPAYSTSSTSSSAVSGGGIGKSGKSSSSSSGYSSSSSSSSRTPHTPPSASSTTSSSSTSSNPTASSSASSAPSRQQPPPQSAPQPPPPPPPPLPVSSSSTQQPPPKPCLSTYGSPVAPVKPTSCLSGQTPPQQHSQSYSPSQPPPSHLSQPYGGFSSPQAQEISSGPGGSGKGFGGLGATGRSFSGDGVYGSESGYGSLPPSLGGAGSPSMGYDGTGHSPALIGSGGGTGSTSSGTGSTGGNSTANSSNSVAGGGAGGSYHLPDSSRSPSINSAIIRPGLHSPAPTHPAQSPGGTGSNKYLSSVLSPNFLASPQGYSDTRAAPQQAQPYHSAPHKSKSETDMLGIERSQEEDEDDDDFLIQHLLHSQSPAPHSSQHHSQQQPSQVNSQQPSAQPQSMSQSREETKGMSAYELNKASEERYQLQSVIRTNNANNNSGPGTVNTAGQGTGPGTSQESQLEISLKKQQTKIDRTVSGAGASGGRGGIDSIPHSHQHAPHTHQHDSLGSVVHYGRGDSYGHQTHQHHSSHSSHTQHSQHPQHSHPHSLSHAHVEVKKATDSSELPYIRKPPDLQQQRSQTSLSHMDSPPDQTQQSQQTHLLQSVLSHSTHSKMDTQQVPQPTPHPMSQQALMGPSGGLGTGSGGSVETQSQASQLQLQLQSQSMESHYGCEAQRNQSQSSQNSVSQLEMLERSLSRTNSRDGAGPTERIVGGDGGANDHQRPQQQLQQQHRMPPHHQTHHPQQTPSELHDFLNESNLNMSAPSHLHHMASHHGHPHSHHQPQPHRHHQHSHQHSRHMPTNTGPIQPQAQPREPEPQISQPQLDQLKDNQFDTESSVVKTTQNQGQNQQQQQQRFMPLTSICFPDSLLQDEDRSFFPAMEDMFCSEDYKPSCAGVGGTGQGDQDIVSEARVNVQDGIESVKAGGGAGGYDMMGHHGDQGYGQYCHSLSESDSGTMHLDLDSLKTHELPSTVNTEQLGLIQSQAPGMGMGVTGSNVDGTGTKIMGNSGVGSVSGTGGLISPIFCSSRPKKLLKTSSFHLLKQRRDPNAQPQSKKTYAQEYEFEDDEDKADVPADIRLNSRRLPDLLPDLVSSCRKSSGGSGVGGLSPLMGDLDFCNPSGYSSLGPPPQLLPHDGPKKRGRKPTKPKREGPPRPRGRPRIRPLPEPPYCRGLMGHGAGESRRGRGRGRGRGRKDDLMLEMHRDINKGQNYQQPHQQAPHLHHQQQLQQQHIQQQHLPQHHLHHHSQPQQHLHPQQQHMHQQQHLHTQHHQHLHQQQTQIQQQHQPQQQYQEPIKPIKIKLPLPSMPSSESLLRTDSLSSTDPVLSDGSVGSAPSLGLSPGPTSALDMNRTDLNCGQDKMKQKDEETEDKPSELKSGFITSFLDFLKTEKKPPSGPLHLDGSSPVDEPSVKGGIRPLSPPPPPPPPPTPPPFGETEGEGGLALSNCPSPCKRLDEELKRNLETLPSFSSDEEDSVSKNQDLQKSISSAISALYDTPHSLAALPPPPTPSPPASQAPPLNTPPPPADSETFPELETRMMAHELHTHTEMNMQERARTPEEEDEPIEDEGPEELEEERLQKVDDDEDGGEEENIVQSGGEDMEKEDDAEETEEFCVTDASNVDDSSSVPPLAPAPPSPPSLSPSPPTSSSPSPLPPPLLSIPSPLPAPEEDSPQPQPQQPPPPQPQPYQAPLLHQSLPPSPSPPALPSPSPPPPTLPPSATPPPSSSPPLPMELPHPSPPSPPTPEDAPVPQITSLHLAKKQDNAAIAGESEEEDSESGGEGIFRERDEFVVRTEDIGTLKLALQTGREPPPIWRVQKALLQKFAPEIKDGQRQFCATSNYLGYFGDAKMRYQRLYVKFLENVNKKDYVRVCSRKPWHRTGVALRRQSLAKPPPTIRSQTPPRVEREEREKARERERQREREQHEQRERERVKERERKEREKEREKEAEQREKEKQEKEKEWEVEREREEREREKQREKEREKQKEKEREKERVREREKQQEKEKEKEREREKQREREREKERQKEKEKEREKQQEKEREEKEREREREREKEKKLQERQNQEKLERRGAVERGRVREDKRGGAGGEKRAEKARSRTVKVKAEPPPKKRKKWLKEVPSSESDSSPSASEDEGSVRSVMNSRAMREMFRSYVEMLVSTALDPDMIQALEDTNDELYLPPMRKIDSILNEQKRRLLRRVTMNAQHQEALHMYPQMSADALESGMVKVRLGGEGYNRKTLNRVKKSLPKQQDLKLSTEMCRIYSLYHSLHHYKYHTFLHCKKETDSIEQAADDPGQEEVVQQCMANQSWLETLFNSFIELLTLSNKL